MTQNELIQTVKSLISAHSCCQELKLAGQKWLDAIGTPAEKAAAEALLQEVKDDICTIDQEIGFFDSPLAVQYFGEEKAKELSLQAHKDKEAGAVWCNCDACAMCKLIIDNAAQLV